MIVWLWLQARAGSDITMEIAAEAITLKAAPVLQTRGLRLPSRSDLRMRMGGGQRAVAPPAHSIVSPRSEGRSLLLLLSVGGFQGPGGFVTRAPQFPKDRW